MADNTQPTQSQPTSGGPVRLEEPSGRRSRRQSKKTVVREIIPMGGFVNFLREHTVVTLAVGFAIATQAQTVIKQLIASFIDPLYGLLFSQKLSSRAFTLHFRGRSQQFAWGQFVYTFIDFLFVLLAIYAIIKIFNLDELEKVEEKHSSDD